jgi:hypothetical protein
MRSNERTVVVDDTFDDVLDHGSSSIEYRDSLFMGENSLIVKTYSAYPPPCFPENPPVLHFLLSPITSRNLPGLTEVLPAVIIVIIIENILSNLYSN